MIEIRLVKHSEEKEQLLDLFRASFGRDMPAKFWEWKYEENPLAVSDPGVIVALDNGKIVGARPFRLAEMWLGNERLKVTLGGNVMVHPEHQRKGIYSQMLQSGFNYLRENGYALAYGFSNANSLSGGLKQGYRIVARTEIMFRPINTRKMLAHKLGNNGLGTGLGYLYDKFLTTKPQEAFQLPASFHVTVFDQFDEEMRDIDSLRDKSLIELVRSENYLRWLFDQRPGQYCRYVLVKKERALWGYAVISVEEENDGLVYGYIADHLVRDRDIDCFRALMNRSLDELGKWGCDIIFVLTTGKPAFRDELLQHLGFKSSLGFPYKKFSRQEYFTAMRIDERAAAGVDVYDRENYRLTYAYW